MPSIKDLKKRIGTVKNTQQTTRAMKMVSAAKLRRAQEAIQSQRPYARQVAGLIEELWTSVSSQEIFKQHSLLRQEPIGAEKKTLLVVVSSDRGLCGGFNSNVVKSTLRYMAQHSAQGNGRLELAFVGKKAYEYFKHRQVQVAAYYPELGGKVTFEKARQLAQTLVQKFTSGEVDEVKLVYNEFKNAVTQKVLVEDFLPLRAKDVSDSESSLAEASQLNYIVKPDPAAVVESLLSKNFSIQAYRILLESQASEHGARMSAMENATKNAGEMIRKLTLQYNKQRQAGITKELLEIIAGSESQKGQ